MIAVVLPVGVGGCVPPLDHAPRGRRRLGRIPRAIPLVFQRRSPRSFCRCRLALGKRLRHGSERQRSGQYLTRSGLDLHSFGNRKVHLIDVTVRVSVAFRRTPGGGNGVPLQLTHSGGGSPRRRRVYGGAARLVAPCTALAALRPSRSSGTNSSTGPSART